MSVRSVLVRLQARTQEYVRGMQRAGDATRDFRSELAHAAQHSSADLQMVARGAQMMGAAILAAVGTVVFQGARFEHAMAQVQAVSGATADEFEAMRRTAIDLGSTTVFSASQAAEATEELAKAGLSAAQITGGALAASLDLAAAGGINLAEAATLSAGAMNAFNLEAHEADRIADTLAAGANRSATNVSELGQGLTNVGVVAAQAGFSLEETVGILSAFADNTLTGAEAGTNMRTTMLRLLAPTEQAKRRMDELGIAVFDHNGEAKDAVSIVRELENGLAGMTQEQRTATLQMLFGQRAIVGANILLAEGADSIEQYVEQVSEMGVAAETAEARLDSLQGDLRLLSSALEGLAIESSGAATGGLRTLTQIFTSLVETIGRIPSPILNAGIVLAGLVGVALLVGGTLMNLTTRIMAMNTALAATGPAGAMAAAGLRRVMRWAGFAAGALIGLQIVDAIFDQFRPAAADADALTDSLHHLADTGVVTGEMVRVFGDDLEHLSQKLKLAADDGAIARFMRSFEGMVGPIGDVSAWLARVTGIHPVGSGGTFTQITEDVEALEAALTAMIEGGRFRDVEQLFRDWVMADPVLTMGDIEDALPRVNELLRAARIEWNETRERVEEVGGELQVTADLFHLTGDNAATAVAEMLEAWAEGAGSFISLTGAYRDALADLEEDAELTADGFIEQLRRQVEAQERWAENMTTLAKRGVDAVLLDELARLGPEGAEMVALMAQMTDEELDEVVELWLRKNMGDAIADQILAGVMDSEEAIALLQGAIDGLEGRDVRIGADTSQAMRRLQELQRHANAIASGQIVAMRHGGVVAAASGMRVPPHVTHSPTVLFGERATGGEAFVPRLGDRDRALAILAEAAAWHKAAVVPMREGGIGGDGASLGGPWQWRGRQDLADMLSAAQPAAGSSTTYNVYPQRADFTVHDLEALQRRQDALSRVGRPG